MNMGFLATLFGGYAKKAWMGAVVGIVGTGLATIKAKSGLDLGAAQPALISWGDGLFSAAGGLAGLLTVFGIKNKA